MLTWLDYYISGYAISFRYGLSLTGRAPDLLCKSLFGKRLDRMTDLEAFRSKLLIGMATQEPPRPEHYVAEHRLGNLAAFETFLAPFALRPEDLSLSDARWRGQAPAMFNVVAVQPSASLVAALSRAKPPSGQDEAVRREFASATWYVDLPHGALLVDGLGIRALLVQPAPTLGTIAVCAVLTSPGSDRVAGRLFWLLGDRRHGLQGIASKDVDRGLLQDEAEDFLTLLALYRAHADKAQKAALPRLTREQATGRKARQHHKKASLFRVETLSPPADRFGRTRTEGQGGWRLGWRSDVRGHFRMQPHGPQKALRKLIFVEGYVRGPEDAPRKHVLERLAC